MALLQSNDLFIIHRDADSKTYKSSYETLVLSLEEDLNVASDITFSAGSGIRIDEVATEVSETVTITAQIDQSKGLEFVSDNIAVKIGEGLTFDSDGKIASSIEGALVYKSTVDVTKTEAEQLDSEPGGVIETPKRTGDTYVNTKAGFPGHDWAGLVDPTTQYQDAFGIVSVTVDDSNPDEVISTITGITIDRYQKGLNFEVGACFIQDDSAELTVDTLGDNGSIATISITNSATTLSDGSLVRIINNQPGDTTLNRGIELDGGELLSWGDTLQVWSIIGKVGLDEVTGFVRITGDTMTGKLSVPSLDVLYEDINVNQGTVITQSLIVNEGGHINKSLVVDENVTIGRFEGGIYNDQFAEYGSSSPKVDLSGVSVNTLVTKGYVDDIIAENDSFTESMLPLYSITPDTNIQGQSVSIDLSGVDGDGNPYGTDTSVNIVGGTHTEVEVETYTDPLTDITTNTNNIIINSTSSHVWEGELPPINPDVAVGDLWYNIVDGRLYVYYSNNDNDSSTSPAWVDASPSAIDGSDYVQKLGDIMSGDLSFEPASGSEKEHTLTCYHYDLAALDPVPTRDLTNV